MKATDSDSVYTLKAIADRAGIRSTATLIILLAAIIVFFWSVIANAQGGTGIGTTYTTYKQRTTNPATPTSTYNRLFFYSGDVLKFMTSAGAAKTVLVEGGAATVSPLISKGPAVINSGFAGTVSTSGSSTTVTFSSAADAILAGYSATSPVLGTTLIAGGQTRYIVSWTNATTCVVNAVVTFAATAITSVQAPVAVFVDSAGAAKGWMLATGRVYFADRVGIGALTALTNSHGLALGATNLDISGDYGIQWNSGDSYINGGGGPASNYSLIFKTYDGAAAAREILRLTGNNGSGVFGNVLIGGLTAAGTNAAKVLGIGSGTAPTTSPADAAQLWVADVGAAAGQAALHSRDELGNSGPLAFAALPEYVEAASDTLAGAQLYGGIVNNYGQANDAVITLPAAAKGMNFTVILGTTVAKYYRIDPNGANVIYLDGVAGAAGAYVGVASATAGYAIAFTAFQTGASAYSWLASTIVGPWVSE